MKTCKHPKKMLLWRDGSVHCYQCNKTWHEPPFPKNAGEPQIWGHPIKTLRKNKNESS